MIKTWQQRCEEHPDHDGIVNEGMIQARMQEEIDELRAAFENAPWVKTYAGGIPNYTTPREWQGLTDNEREQFRQWAHPDIIEAIELRLQERNT